MKRLKHLWFVLYSLGLLRFKWMREMCFAKPTWGVSRWTAFWCRIRQHPEGPTFYNVTGSEPDMRCINCGDDLG